MKRLQPTEYMYASARIRALETRLVGRERMELLGECRSAGEVMDRLSEYGLTLPESDVPATGETLGRLREAMLLSALQEAYDEVEAAVPDPTVFRYFRYPYDCNNLKAAIKCGIRGVPAEDMLFDFGTVPAHEVEALVREGKYEAYPAAMAAAARRARELYEKTADPRMIDAVLDAACYEDMLTAARETGDDTLVGWLQMRIDLTNILITLRILRLGKGFSAGGVAEDLLIPGGTLDAAFFGEALENGESRLWEVLSPTEYYPLTRVEGDPRPLYAVEKACDDLYVERVRTDAGTPFGAAVAGGYLVGWETAVKNIRILLAAKEAGWSTETIRERIRVSYV